jgi:transposase
MENAITKRNHLIADAVHKYGYSQMEVARQVGLHYSTVSRLIKSVALARS